MCRWPGERLLLHAGDPLADVRLRAKIDRFGVDFQAALPPAVAHRLLVSALAAAIA